MTGFAFAFVSFSLLINNFRYNLAAVMCDLKPRGATGSPNPAGNKYRIVIATYPERYVPGQTYNVILQGRNSVVQEPNQFNGFALTVKPVDKSEDSVTLGPLAAGIFRLLPHESNTKIDEFCPNTVVHTSHTFVSSIEVQWVAPNPGIGCVHFRAAVMEQHVWYRNGGGLTLELCEMEEFQSTNIPERCCSCNEAKYEMKFEGLWTRQSHPRFYPDNSWLTRFSDVIGASHAFDYRFWKVNESASPGLIEFSEKENTTLLESEIKSNKTRTVIKAKGLSHPTITGKTFAVFRVDPEHHLLSIISLIKPSPDWFVGISGLALCDDKCNWTQQKTLDLYPYDLGLYADLKYESKVIPKDELIHKIDHFNILESPFYTNNEEKLKPLARIYLIKAREYEKQCNTNEMSTGTKLIEGSSPGTEEPFPRSPMLQNESVGSSILNATDDIVEECNNTQFRQYSKCSVPECDLERVRIEYRQFNDRIRQQCQNLQIPAEKISSCKEICIGGKKPTSKETLRKCAVSEFPPSFSPCDPIYCQRNRTRFIMDKSKKNDLDCLHIQFTQSIECPPQECQHEK